MCVASTGSGVVSLCSGLHDWNRASGCGVGIRTNSVGDLKDSRVGSEVDVSLFTGECTVAVVGGGFEPKDQVLFALIFIGSIILNLFLDEKFPHPYQPSVVSAKSAV